jgi:hypothetical protein
MFGFGDLSGSHLEPYAWCGMVAVVPIVLHDLGFRHLRRKYPEVLRGPQEVFLQEVAS